MKLILLSLLTCRRRAGGVQPGVEPPPWDQPAPADPDRRNQAVADVVVGDAARDAEQRGYLVDGVGQGDVVTDCFSHCSAPTAVSGCWMPSEFVQCGSVAVPCRSLPFPL